MKSYSLLNIFSISGVFLLSLFACNSPNEKKQEKKPLNIIYIMADDHAYQAVSAYGHNLNNTPLNSTSFLHPMHTIN